MDIDEFIYWNYVALEQSNVKQKDDIFAKLENALDVLSTRDLKKYFKSSSVLKYARSKKYYDRSLEVIRQFADDFSKINEDNFVSSCVPVYIPSAITFFVDQLFIDGTPNWQDLSSISRLFLMPIKYFEEQLQIQIDDYDDEYAVCDRCGEPCATDVLGKPRDRFCKWCGAKMEAET